jgi:hypothetical protein
MLSPAELLKVADAYAEATGRSLITVGRDACGNDKIFIRIRAGGGAVSRSIEQATAWFEANWPKSARWPAGVPGRPRRMVPRRPRARCAAP